MYLFKRNQITLWWFYLIYLHSTMYLFKPWLFYVWFVNICIYIPLCIYFNGYSDSIQQPFQAIYIPLCIYFNFKAILAPLVRYNLHSTMYLFQPSDCRNPSKTGKIYIPLCIYFNTSLSDNLWAIASGFTFHYVSISTLFATILSALIVIYIPLCIYFNMTEYHSCRAILKIYIPLCIYFNLF